MPLSILLAEDNPVVRSMMADFLRGEGHEVDVVASGSEAWHRLESTKRYDLMLLDLCLPAMDGIELLQRIRRNAVHCQTPVVILSGDRSAETRQNVLNAGATEFWQKPISPSELIDRVAVYQDVPVSEGEVLAALDVEVMNELVHALASDEKAGRILAAFSQSLRDYADRLHRAAQEQDQTVFLDSVHSLKGAAGMFGAKWLVDWCLQVEALAQAGVPCMGDATLHAMDAAIESTCRALKQFIGDKGR